jgi:hypothetical protein
MTGGIPHKEWSEQMGRAMVQNLNEKVLAQQARGQAQSSGDFWRARYAAGLTPAEFKTMLDSLPTIGPFNPSGADPRG